MLRAVAACQAVLLALLFDSPAGALGASPVPLTRGTYWEYRESYTEVLGEVDSTTDGTTRFEVRGRAERPYIHQEGGADPSPGPVEAGDGWIRLTPWTGEDALPLPLLPGRSGPRAEGGGAWTVEAEEDVEVPAGTFRSLRCALRGPGSESLLWIVPGVGVVRETQGTGRPGRRPEIERVLLSWARP
jgi:hypothetical protein